eukprot:8737542-Pyramimonas_sp.AAC.1
MSRRQDPLPTLSSSLGALSCAGATCESCRIGEDSEFRFASFGQPMSRQGSTGDRSLGKTKEIKSA